MKTKQILLIAGILLFIQAIFAQIPPGYYNTATGTGATLKTQLYNIIKGHTDKGYGGLYACYTTTDNLPGNKVFDMYSVKADSTAAYWFTNSASSADQCGNYGAESDCYNREHSFCDSWLGAASPQRSDLFHVYPTDGYVNNRRNNYPQGKVGSVTWTSTNGSKLGYSDATTGYTGIVFEPIDAFKGDFARSYFYVATRYENLIAGWASNTGASELLAGNAYPAYKTWFLNLMIQWHNQDPVSQKEILRNEAVYGYQHNRNPYIDHPEWVSVVWGGTTVAVTSITVNSAGNATTISSPLGTLQMSAVIAPSTATNQTYTWSVVAGTGTASISTSGLLTATTNGTVTVKATANDGSNVFGTKLITLSNQTVGVAQYQGASNITFYPNPVENVLTIDLTSTSTLPELIWISDVTGKVVYQTTPDHSKVSIDMTNLNKGVYFLNFNSKQTKTTYKLVH
jgi:endonuclease I